MPGAQAGVQWQVQAQVDRAGLGGTPSEAFKRAGQIRNSLERSFPGKIQFVDNLSEALETAAGDALYAEALFIMLAVPGALLALGLAYLAALGTVERDRRELALLRARGASRRQLLGMAAANRASSACSPACSAPGLSFAAVALLIEGSVGLNADPGGDRRRGLRRACDRGRDGGAARHRVASAVGNRGRRQAQRPEQQGAALAAALPRLRRPRDQRPDLLAHRQHRVLGGGQPRLQPDPLALDLHVLRPGPALDRGDAAAGPPARGVFGAVARRLRGSEQGPSRRTFLLASASRRGPAINRGLIFVGLLLAFGVSLGVFAATYNQQAGVDAQLTLGADITATAPPGVTAKQGLAKRIEGVPGVAATSAVDHSYAYVGPDLQDTFGIDPATIGKATTLRDSYFIGGGAQTMLSRLQSSRTGSSSPKRRSPTTR